jgi:hypothetical protein
MSILHNQSVGVLVDVSMQTTLVSGFCEVGVHENEATGGVDEEISEIYQYREFN